MGVEVRGHLSNLKNLSMRRVGLPKKHWIRDKEDEEAYEKPTERSSVAITSSEDSPVETWGREMALGMAQWSRSNMQQRFYKALGGRHNHYIMREMAGVFPACTRPFLGFLLVLCRLGVLCGTEDRGKHKRIKMDLLRWRF